MAEAKQTPFGIAAAQSASAKGDIAANAIRHVEFAELATRHGADAIVFPELSLTGYEPTVAAECALTADAAVLQPLREASRELQITIVAGAPLKSNETRPYIGAIAFHSHGDATVYRKRFVHSTELGHFVASNDVVTCPVADHVLGIAICADTSHAEHPAELRKTGATIYAAGVMMVPDDGRRAEIRMAEYARQHSILAVMANYSAESGGFPTGGRSGIWDEAGRLVAQADAQGDSLVIATESADSWRGQVVTVPARHV